MSKTNSINFPNMLDPTTGRASIAEDNMSIINRVRLLMLTDPTELYNEPVFGVGLKKYLFQYNNDNVRAIIQSKIVDQLRAFEPCANADKTSFADGLLFTGESSPQQEYNKLKMTVGVSTIFGDTVNVSVDS